MPATLSKDDRIGEIKSVLRSLLISKGSRDITVPQLNHMYRDMEERNIPFKEFGYASLQSFLNDLPDTLRLVYNRNNELCAYHVNTEKSAHISSLVSRQKKVPIRKTKSAHSYRPRNNHYNFPRPIVKSTYPTVQNYCSVPTSVVIKVMEELREASRNSSSNGGIRKVDVLARVKGKDAKYSSFTIQNLNSQLYQLSHILRIENDCIYYKDDVRMSQLTVSRPSNSVSQEEFFRSQQNATGPSNLVNQSEKLSSQQNASKPSHSVTQNNYYKSQQSSCKPTNFVSQDPIVSNGFSNHTETVVKERSEEAHQNSASVRQEKEVNVVCDIITERTKIRLEKLIEKHPEGIWCSELPNVYRNEYKVDLEYKELGFNSITEFVAALPNIFQIVEPPNAKRQMVLNAKKPIDDVESNHQRKTLASHYNYVDYTPNEPEPVPIKLSSRVSRTLIPEGVMGFDETVDQILASSLINDEYIEVIISDIFTPSFFWITLRKSKKKIKALMNDLDAFYSMKDLDLYKIPQVVLKPGLNIACIYAKLWHRAIIKKIKPDGFVVVFFYDYGTVKTYNPNELYFLHRKFSSLPAQAIACGLHNIRPIGTTEWSNQSINAFIARAYSIPLIAIISNINEENNTMMISLTDTSDDETDLHINDWMVEKKFAEWGKMVSSVPMHKLCMYDQSDYYKLYADNYNQPPEKPKSNTDFEIKRSEITSPTPSSNYLDSCYDTSNVAILLKENTDLTKQTNTLAQAILLNMPINKSDISNDSNMDSKNITANARILDNQSTHSESHKKFLEDLNSSLSNLKINVAEMNSNLYENESADSAQFTSVSSKQYPNGNFEDHQSSVQSSLSFASIQDYKFSQTDNINIPNGLSKLQEHSNECIEESSVYSTASCRSTYDFRPTQQINLNYDIKLTDDSDNSDNFSDGTPFIEVKVNDNLSKKSNRINIKYPSNFANLHMNNLVNDNTINGNITENLNGNLNHHEEIRTSDHFTTRPSITKSNINGYSINLKNTENSNRHLNNREEADSGYCTTTRLSTSHTASTSHTHNSNVSSASNVITSRASPCIVVRLSERCNKKAIHMFHLENEGWLCAYEFVNVFTNLKDIRVMLKLLQILDYNVNFKHITREAEPTLFAQLDMSKLKVPREENKKIASDFVLILMPLKAMLQILVKLDFLSTKMLKEAVPLIQQSHSNIEELLYEQFNSKILYDALNLLLRYKQFKRLHRTFN